MVHHLIETVMNSLSIVFNCYLLYLIRYHSTFGEKLYKHLLTIDSALDLMLGVTTFVAQPMALTGNGQLLVITTGFLADRSRLFDTSITTLFVWILHTNVVWIAVQFLYRYRLLCKSSKSFISNTLIVTVAVTHSAIAFVVFHFTFQARPEFQPMFHAVLDLNNWPNHSNNYIAGGDIKDGLLVVFVVLSVVTCWSSIFIVIWCEKSIAKHFNELGEYSTQSSTQKMHKEFQRALLAMAICPLVTTTLPVLYFMFTIAFRLNPGIISALMTICLSSITIFNPLTIIICFRCYRHATLRLFTFWSHKNSVGQTRNAVSATRSSN
ncbi:serpentine type 7TM GPCR chemoreceptor str domain-containing protein [Ditylenchus destructor]|uniref:Serpentine type 7TM GPCR chemoreceptor str domain-containing protein n=1 Tax=Ditylenchus destructor TaxID=166010 RepID=A0AAD4QRZ1_9BILA|nr:serpentine type 7TM GPCR chemoreceptor str domain-containing protein [Ditylenchus destructor]